MKSKLLFMGMIALTLIPIACNPIKDSVLGNNNSSASRYPSSLSIQSHQQRPARMTGKITGNRHALVIANANYTGDPNIVPLKNPLNDGRDMKKTLQEVGFQVVYRENATNRRQIKEAVREFTNSLRPGDVGVFYYAGHAVQVKGKNYLIPTQVQLPSQRDVEYETLSAQYVLDQMEDAGNGFNIVLLDACRDNPLPEKKTRSIGEKGGLAEMRQPKGSIIGFATSPNDVAEDGTGRNGLYTKHLLKAIKTPGLTVEEMLKKVRDGVWEETGGTQIPWENSSLRGDFCFSGCVTKEQRATETERIRLEQEKAQLEREKARLEAQLRDKKNQPQQQNTHSEALRQKQEEKNRQLEERLNALEQQLRQQQDNSRQEEDTVIMPPAF
jgi:hypothetical protein